MLVGIGAITAILAFVAMGIQVTHEQTQEIKTLTSQAKKNTETIKEVQSKTTQTSEEVRTQTETIREEALRQEEAQENHRRASQEAHDRILRGLNQRPGRRETPPSPRAVPIVPPTVDPDPIPAPTTPVVEPPKRDEICIPIIGVCL